MQNDSIVVTAKLNVDASEALILRDLEKIQGDLEKNPLKINCVVSDATLKNIQAQINNIASNLNVNVGVITAQSIMSDNTARHIEQNVQAVQSSLNSIVDTVQNVQNRSNVRMNLQINAEAIDRFIQRLNVLGVEGINIDELRERLEKLNISIEKISPTFTKLQRNGTDVLTGISIKGKDAIGQMIDYTERWSAQVNKETNQVTTKFNNATTKVTQNFEEMRVAQEKIRKESETNQAALNKFLSLQGKYNVIQSKYGDNAELANQLQTIKQLIDSFNNSAPIEKQQESLIRIDNELKLIAVDIEKIQSKGTLIKSNLYPDISKVAAVGTDNSAQLESAKNQLNEYFKNIAQVEDSVTRIKRAVSDTTGELTKFYIQVEKEDKSVETLTYALNKQGTAYEFVSKAIREADNSTDFRRKGLDVQKAIKTEEVNKFITQLKEANLYTGELKTKADELNNSIAQIADTNAMNKFLDDFDIAKAKFAAMKEESRSHNNSLKDTEKYINDAIKALEKFNNASVTKRNASNTDVITQTGTNANLITQLQGLSQSLKDDSSATNLQRVRQVIDTLSGSIEKATTDSAALNQQLINMSADDRLSNHINNLINQMNKFANINPKVTKSLKQMRDGMTFADKWQQMVNMLQSGKLDSNAIQQLTNDFRNFKGEADSANLTTSRFFTSMQSQLRMVLQRWISLYAVIGYIRKMIDNIKELDTAMINLQRVTHETGEGYERFLANASDRAKELKTTTSALIEQSYQWAKLGYDMEDSLKLSEASTIFSRVADVGQEQALKNLVTAMKAYGIEAEDVMSIVDKLDKLNNEYAVSAAGLGDGLERAASAMAMTGNSIDQTLAMLTGAGEITQNLENTANGLRIVGLR